MWSNVQWYDVKNKTESSKVEILKAIHLSIRYNPSYKWDHVILKPGTELLQRDWCRNGVEQVLKHFHVKPAFKVCLNHTECEKLRFIFQIETDILPKRKDLLGSHFKNYFYYFDEHQRWFTVDKWFEPGATNPLISWQKIPKNKLSGRGIGMGDLPTET